MAAVIGDYATDPHVFQNMIATSQRTHDPQYLSSHRHVSSPRFRRADSSSGNRFAKHGWDSDVADKAKHSSGGASRFPSPPSSSSESLADQRNPNDDNTATDMAPEAQAPEPPVEPALAPKIDVSAAKFAPISMPSPDSEERDVVHEPAPARPLSESRVKSPVLPQKVVHVRDLKHIQELARENDMGNGPGVFNEPPLQSMKYEISGMPIHDIIEMIAALLTKITSTNDLQHDAMSRNASYQQHASSHHDGTREASPYHSSVVAFHGKNVPAITILAYLARIHKYCPTTYEVFLSLLVYFDRMTERVNSDVQRAEREKVQKDGESRSKHSVNQKSIDGDIVMVEVGGDDLADEEPSRAGTSAAQPTASGAPAPATYFVVDSFNIHRLIIAGVTCASKFFSDVFYTNSRYAKVGGVQLNELNHLEVQFLELNDFRLFVAVEDLEAYATMLVEFYAREVVAQKSKSTSSGAV